MPKENQPEETGEAKKDENDAGRKFLEMLIEIRTEEERMAWISDKDRTMSELKAVFDCIHQIRINQLLSNISEERREKYGITDPDTLKKDSAVNYPPIICNQINGAVKFAMRLKETSDQPTTPTQ